MNSIYRNFFYPFALFCLSSCTIIDTKDEIPALDRTMVLTGGTVYSGENAKAFVADVWIKNDRIVGIGEWEGASADLVLDVTDLAVVPGFIDLHSHAIRSTERRSGLYRWPDAENVIRMGVTTVIGGPDGWSPLPLESAFDRLEASPGAINFGATVGHGAVREKIIGLEDRPPTAEELEQMQAEVDLAMRQGAFGLSSGLVYTPGMFGETEEIIELARVAAKHGGIYKSHMRNEALEVLDSVAELIRIAEEAGLPAQITHAKAMGTAMQGKSVKLLAMVDAAVARGLDITLDQYPYPAGHTGLTVQFPLWSRDGGNDRLRERMQDPELRERIKKELIYQMTHVRGRNDPANVQISYCNWNPSLDGKTLTQILEEQHRDVNMDNATELLMELVAQGGCGAIYHAMHPDDVVRIMQHPRTMIASDGGVEVPGNAHPHPRNYGTYPRVLGRYVREQNVMPFHTAIHKMSRMPADRIGLSDRGRIEPGAMADITILDPNTIIDRSTFTDPHQYSEGVEHVFVAGEAVLLNGEMTGARPGRVLRSSSYEGDQ